MCTYISSRRPLHHPAFLVCTSDVPDLSDLLLRIAPWFPSSQLPSPSPPLPLPRVRVGFDLWSRGLFEYICFLILHVFFCMRLTFARLEIMPIFCVFICHGWVCVDACKIWCPNSYQFCIPS